MLSRYAIVDTAEGLVLSVIEYSEAPTNPPPGFVEGIIAVPSDKAGPGWQWDGSKLVAPVVPEPPIIVPPSATKLGLKRALAELGRWQEAKTLMASNEAVQEEWDLAIEIKRSDALAQIIIAAMQLSEAEVDAILIRAAALV